MTFLHMSRARWCQEHRDRRAQPCGPVLGPVLHGFVVICAGSSRS
ncbi:hypothetical protein QJS66_12790 [Kocuria rhizophila]|nr:hypothetical protein QJS66_12790 [Kocuria rhizophila]